MINKELKPCPFCGGTNIDCADAGYKTDMWFVQCDDCGATFRCDNFELDETTLSESEREMLRVMRHIMREKNL